MKILLCLIANIILVSCSMELGIDYDELYSFNDLFESEKNCTKPGMMCKSCEELILCIEIEGNYEQMELEICDKEAGETCLIDKCSKDPNPLCSENIETEFECTATAVFPDPYNCNIYHICAQKTEIVGQKDNDKYYHYAMKCDNDYGYDPITTYCKVHLQNNACPDKLPVPTCTQLGQTGALINPSIYYICKMVGDNKLAPELHLCPHGKKYVGGKCS